MTFCVVSCVQADLLPSLEEAIRSSNTVEVEQILVNKTFSQHEYISCLELARAIEEEFYLAGNSSEQYICAFAITLLLCNENRIE